MTKRKIWATSQDGSIEYVSINPELLQPSIEAMQQSFYVHENICVAFNMHNQPESFPEMDVLLLNAAQDGVSIAAIEKSTGKVVGAAFNKLEDPVESDFYSKHAKSCKYEASQGVARWMNDIGNMFNIFEHCNVKNVMEIMFLGIVPEFRKKGIAKTLCEVSIEVGRHLKQGRNVKVSINDKPLELGDPPEIITGIFTSFVTQKIANDLKFVLATQISFNKFIYDGRSLGDVIQNKTPYLTYEYLKV